MKVRCTKLIDTQGNPQERSNWLTVGKMYHVLSVILDENGRWLLQLMDVLTGLLALLVLKPMRRRRLARG